MFTIKLWLLISVGQLSYAGHPTQVVERFATAQECQRIAQIIRGAGSSHGEARVICVEATIAREVRQ